MVHSSVNLPVLLIKANLHYQKFFVLDRMLSALHALSLISTTILQVFNLIHAILQMQKVKSTEVQCFASDYTASG